MTQLLEVYHEFCKALDDGKEIRTVFFDISKAFDRVWHRGLLAKLKSAGVKGKLLQWFTEYLKDRRQRVIIPGASSDWSYIKAGVPQGSILGPLLFLVYINDIVSNIQSNIRLFADDTSLYIIVEHINSAALTLNKDIETITSWSKKWLVTFNPSKTESLTVSRKRNKPVHPSLKMLDEEISEKESHKHLGVILSNDGSWHLHIEHIKSKAWKRINLMRKLKFILNRDCLETIYFSFIRPILEYADVIWDNCTKDEKEELDKIQHEAARIVTGATKLVSIENLYKETGWQTLETRRKHHKLILFYKMLHDMTPPYLSSLIPQPVGATTRYNLRNSGNLQTPLCRSKLYKESFIPSFIHLWNSLPQETRDSPTLAAFKHSLQNSSVTKPPPFYRIGQRDAQIHHTRLRTNCSALNLTLFQKNVVESPLCHCGELESTDHYFFICQTYNDQRQQLLNTVNPICNATSILLLFGDSSLTLDQNIIIFDAVQKYILATKRFRTQKTY